MKRFYILLMVILAAPMVLWAQGAKPTKEQTEAYILQKINGGIMIDSQGDVDIWHKITFDFNESMLKIEEKLTEKNAQAKVLRVNKVKIDLSKIQEIKVGVEIFESQIRPKWYFLKFFCEPLKKCISENDESRNFYGIYFTSTFSDADWFDDESVVQLEKAFNHLRKLHGAPDPISFD